MSRTLLAVAAALVALLTYPAASLASGGNSVADAPMLAYGQVTGGGGLEQEFWHMQVFSGDVIRFTADLGGAGTTVANQYGFTLYSPEVTDYNLRGAPAATLTAPSIGKNEFTLRSPFSGIGTLDVCEGNINTDPCGELAVDIITPLEHHAEPYTFTATVTHATVLSISAPRLAHRRSVITIRAAVESPAGTPEGTCVIQGAIVPLVGGKCSKRVRVGHGSKQTIKASFVPNDGWQGAAGHRRIQLAR